MSTVATPIGSLIVEATQHARKKKSGGHTATSPCGCSVTVAFFSAHSSTLHIDRCAAHPNRSQR